MDSYDTTLLITYLTIICIFDSVCIIFMSARDAGLSDYWLLLAVNISFIRLAFRMAENKFGYNQSQLNSNISKLRSFLRGKDICQSHGIDHMMKVMELCKSACRDDPEVKPNKRIRHLICCAGLFHDIDDRKLFPDSTDYDNLRLLMNNYPSVDIDLVVEMVSYVSCSENGDRIPDRAINYPWLLYPRFSDRIEAIGQIGMARCYLYNLKINNPLCVETTPRASNETELWNIATEIRYNNYHGKSLSMIDHYYDKLLRLGMFETTNTFLDRERKDKIDPMVKFVLNYGTTGIVDEEQLKIYVEEMKLGFGSK